MIVLITFPATKTISIAPEDRLFNSSDTSTSNINKIGNGELVQGRINIIFVCHLLVDTFMSSFFFADQFKILMLGKCNFLIYIYIYIFYIKTLGVKFGVKT